MISRITLVLALAALASACASQSAPVVAPVTVDVPPATAASVQAAPPLVTSSQPSLPSGIDPPRATDATDGEPTGVSSCDEYIQVWRNCYRDPAMRAAAQPGLDQMVAAWKAQATDPATRAALAAGCQMALDNFPKAACK